jgi:4-amino-4-deoxy-L-arabinose transferase-like glycosyltransferase
LAAPLYFKGLRPPQHPGNIYEAGTVVLHSGGEYWRNLALARSGGLLFLWLAGVCIYVLGSRLFGPAAGVLAVLCFTLLPPVLNMASLAYNDLALAAALALFAWRWLAWLSAHHFRNAVWVGIAAGVAVGTKYSAIPYIAALAAATAILLRREAARRMLGKPRLAIAASLAMALTLWGAFRFAVVPISTAQGAHPMIDGLLPQGSIWERAVHAAIETPVPLGSLAPGIADLLSFRQSFNQMGEPYYFMGAVRREGIWFYFPVMLLSELPLPFWGALALAWTAWARGAWSRENRLERGVVLAAPFCILGVNMIGGLTFAPRHLSGCYPFLAVAAAAALAALWRNGRFRFAGKAAAFTLAVLLALVSVRAHPDYHAYQSVLGAWLNPVRALDGSKDVARLARLLKELDVDEISVALSGTNDLSRMDLPAHVPLEPYRFTGGWIAISERRLRIHGGPAPPYDGFAWLEKYSPVAMAGRSIRIYYIPEDSAKAVTPPNGEEHTP